MARHKIYYKGEGNGFPQVRAVVSFVSSCLPVVHSCTKMLKLRINQLVVWFVQVHVSNWLLVILPNPHLGVVAHPSTPKCYESRSTPQLLLLPLFSPLDSQLSPSRSLGVCHIWWLARFDVSLCEEFFKLNLKFLQLFMTHPIWGLGGSCHSWHHLDCMVNSFS